MRRHLLLLLPLACSTPDEPPAPAPAPVAKPSGEPDRFADRRPLQPLERFEFPDAEEPSARDDGLEPVARLELLVPDRDPFVVHGTLPVPDGFRAQEDGRTPLAVVPREQGAAPVPAQVTPLVRSAAGDPEVLSLAASIRRPEGVRPGDRLRVDVIEGSFPIEPGPPPLPEATTSLVAPDGPHPVELRTRDVHGNVYRVDLRGAPTAPGFGAREVRRDGPVRRVVRTYSTLMPVETAGEGDPRPHLMGVHAYWTLLAGRGSVGLDLRVHNGATSGSREARPEEEPLGIVHWDALELVLPADWRVDALAPDPFLGEARVEEGRRVVPLVRAPEDGSLHVMPPQAQLQRRLVLRPRGAPRARHPLLEGLAFPRGEADLWSWWNPRTPRYFPQRALLPDFGPLEIGPLRGERALRSRLAGERDALRDTLAEGKPVGDVLAGARMGWAHPRGVSVQGMTGGRGIRFLEGHQAAAAASAAGVEKLALQHRMNAARQPEAQWNRYGEPVGHDEWLDEEGRVPFDFRTNGRMVPPVFRLPARGGPPADPQVRAVHLADRRPDYARGSPHRPDGRLTGRDDDLFSWMPHDGQHYARWTHPPMALVWVADDPLAADDVRLAAESFHLMFHGSEHRPASWSPGVTLLQYEELAAAHPHHGLPLTRDHAWGVDVMCAAWSLADDDWRARREEWFRRVGRLFVRGAMPSGLLPREEVPKLLGGRHGGAQAFECLFLLHAQRALIESVLGEVDPPLAQELAGVHQRSLDYLFWGPVWDCLPAGDQTQCGPRHHFATGPAGGWDEPPYSHEPTYGERYLPADGLEGGVEMTYVWAPLEYGMLLARGDRGPSLDDRYLRRALACDRAAGTWPALVEDLFQQARRGPADNSGNWGSLVGRVQTLR